MRGAATSWRVWLFVLSLSASVLPAQTPDVLQWRRWEKAIDSSVDFTLNQGNPYRDLTLRVRFSGVSTATGLPESLTQDAFWVGDTSLPRRFKVRTALPAGTWHWEVAGCSGSTGNVSCATGVTWTPSSGDIVVGPTTGSGVKLYDRGFPVQLVYQVSSSCTGTCPPLAFNGFGDLRYGDYSEPFVWMADTAWSAVSREAIQQPAARRWDSYLSDRRAKGFTVVLLAPQPAWKPEQGETWPALPDPEGLSFAQIAGCTSTAPIPNDCSRPLPAYWDRFDSMVDRANAQGLAVVVAGTVDPSDRGRNGTYPQLESSRDFSRYLAARLAGNAVFYSPTFDDRLDSRTQGGVNTLREVVTAITPAIRAASPRALLTLHLAGSANCTEYESYRTSGWMTFFLYHSGHSFTQQDPAAPPCAPRAVGEDQVDAALRRAREIPLTLTASTAKPRMPAINGEGPYDGFPVLDEPVDNRYRVRHAAYVTLLSNGRGFTYGATNLGIWDQVDSLLGIDSAEDMRRLAARFRSLQPLQANHAAILNQITETTPTQTKVADSKQMVLATDNVKLLLAYLPGDLPKASIVIAKSALPDLDCVQAFTMTWFDPASNGLVDAFPRCASSGSQIEIVKPENCASGPCDWLLEIVRTRPIENLPDEIPPGETTDPWLEASLNDDTTGIFVRQSLAPDSRIEVSPPGRADLRSPEIVRLGHRAEAQLLVWEANGLDGSLYGIFGRLLGLDGHPLGPEFQVNATSELDQRDPDVVADGEGNALVVWSSDGQGGDRAGIFGQRFNPLGQPVGIEFRISQVGRGHPGRPQVALKRGGGFVVAWTTEDRDRLPRLVSVMLLSREGSPLSREVLLGGVAGRPARALAIHTRPDGRFVLRFADEDEGGRQRAQYEQLFDTNGAPVGVPSIFRP